MQPQDPNQPKPLSQPDPQTGAPNGSGEQPPVQPAGQQSVPQQIYYTRPLEPQSPAISEEIRQQHEASKKKYPRLNLSEGEYVISDVRRHPIGLVGIWTFVTLFVATIVTILALVMESETYKSMTIPVTAVGLATLLICSLALIAGYIGTYVYRANRFYLTNESIIQNIQYSLFANREQTISLSSVEDASYTKTGIIQNMLDYGSIRLSTMGDETTYRFHFASSPEKQIAILNNAVEAFKNGRPVTNPNGH